MPNAEPLDPRNPFSAPSDLPYGLPPFDRIAEEHFRPAFEAGIAQQQAEVSAIAADPATPTVRNTLEAMERSGALLRRVSQVFFNLVGSHAGDSLRALEEELAPVLSAHHDAIHLDPALFARIDDLFARREELGLDGEDRRLLERYRTDFLRAGAGLPAGNQQRLRDVNEELSRLTAGFGNRLLADTNDLAVHVEDVGDLDGLPEDAVAAAAEAARTRGHAGGYLLPLVLPTAQPVLASLRNRSLRERVHRAAVSRGSRGNGHDTREVLARTVELRGERARLLGFPDHASYVIDDQTAGTVDAVDTLLRGLMAPAVRNARAEAAELEAALHADGEAGPLQPWDWAFYANRLRTERHDVDGAALRPYFELDRVLHDGVFLAATRLYGLTFQRRDDLPSYHPDVRTFEVLDADGTALGLFLCDWFARDTKRGGAWMSSYVDQSELLGQRPVVVVNLNVPRPPAGEPALMTTDEVDTAFHEFGHALHGLFSDVRYPRLSGTSVPRDFVEYPSQVNEMWAWRPEVLACYAVHHRTGRPLPPDAVRSLLDSRSDGEGYRTTEYLAAALLDLEWHRLAADAEPVRAQDVEAFEQAALERSGLALETVPPRYRSSYFAHVFAGGYSAGYYSYLWSEVLDADTVEWFEENGGLRRENGDTFRRLLLSRGGAVDPMEAFAAVRGREPDTGPLLRRRRLTGAG